MQAKARIEAVQREADERALDIRKLTAEAEARAKELGRLQARLDAILIFSFNSCFAYVRGCSSAGCSRTVVTSCTYAAAAQQVELR